MSSLVVANDDQFRWLSRRLADAGGGLATRLGLANPLAKRFRTGLLLGMYALIVFVLVFMAVFAAVFQAQAPRITADTSAGYDLRVDSSLGNPVDAAPTPVASGRRAGDPAGPIRGRVPSRVGRRASSRNG